jgi:ribosome assembly protein YihI (activator of Der GTPase)
MTRCAERTQYKAWGAASGSEQTPGSQSQVEARQDPNPDPRLGAFMLN